MKRKILFFPAFEYSSYPLFSSLNLYLKNNYSTILFEPNDPFLFYRRKTRPDDYFYKYDEYIDFKIEESPFMNAYLTNTISYKLKHIFKFISCLKLYESEMLDLIKQISPSVIITTTDSTRSSMIVNRWAFRNKLPFIICQPTFIDTVLPNMLTRLKRIFLHVFFNMVLSVPFIYKQNVFGNEYSSNYIFVWGKKFKNMYKGLKIEENVFVVGNPLFDDEFVFDIDRNNEQFIHLPRPIVTICTEALKMSVGYKKEQIINEIYKETISNNPELSFVIKLHPRDDLERYRDIFSDIKAKNFLLINNLEIKEVLRFSSVQISVNSFSSFEAAAFGIPIILVRKEFLDSVDYFNNEIDLRASNSTELTFQIKRALTKEFQSEYRIRSKAYLKSIIEYSGSNSLLKISQCVEDIIKYHNIDGKYTN